MEDIGKLCKEFEKTFSLFAMIASGKIIIVIMMMIIIILIIIIIIIMMIIMETLFVFLNVQL